ANMSRPSGGLTAPGAISDETANRLKKDFEEKFSGRNVGRVFIAGDGLKYEPMRMPASDAQLIEQLKWSVTDVARCFHMPLFKIGGDMPARMTVEGLNQLYYSDCLQSLMKSMEDVLTEGLGMPTGYCVKFDVEDLLRMDAPTRYKARSDAVSGGWMSP